MPATACKRLHSVANFHTRLTDAMAPLAADITLQHVLPCTNILETNDTISHYEYRMQLSRLYKRTTVTSSVCHGPLYATAIVKWKQCSSSRHAIGQSPLCSVCLITSCSALASPEQCPYDVDSELCRHPFGPTAIVYRCDLSVRLWCWLHCELWAIAVRRSTRFRLSVFDVPITGTAHKALEVGLMSVWVCALCVLT